MSTLDRVRPEHIGIIGGGPAGAAAALASLDRGFAVTLIEKSSFTRVRVGEHLSPNGIPLLDQLGVLVSVRQGAHIGCSGVRSAWGEGSLDDKEYLFGPHGDGLNLSRPAFDALLAEAARRRGADLLTETRLNAITRQDEHWQLDLLQRDRQIRREVDFVIDASGRTAAAATRLGARRIVFDKLVGLVGFMSPDGSQQVPADEDENGTLLLESAECGWWYCAPLSDGRLVAAYMTDADLAARQKPLELWRARLDETLHIRQRCKGMRPAEEVIVRPACSQRLDRVAGAGWLAVGDAALSIDPLSSAGITKGLQSGLRAADAIATQGAGDTGALEDYHSQAVDFFDEYMVERAGYYRIEERWPDSPFWKRRQLPVAGELPITLDPSVRIRATEFASPERAKSILHEFLPTVDHQRLLRLTRSDTPAHEVISRYQTQSRRRHGDRDVIVALQLLLGGKLLRTQEMHRMPPKGQGQQPRRSRVED